MQRKKVYHTQTHIHTYSLLLSHPCLSLGHQGKAGACQGYATPGCQLQLLSTRICFFCFSCLFLFSVVSFLASVAVLLVHVHAVSPLNDKGIP